MEKLSNNFIVDAIADKVDTLAKGYSSSKYYEDFRQELYIILLTFNNDRLNELYYSNKLIPFVVGIIKNQYNSKTSSFYRKYKLYDINRQDLDVVEDTNDDWHRHI